METKAYQTYEEAAQDYMAEFRALRQPPAAREAAARGPAKLPVETLIEQADRIAGISARMVPLAEGYLSAPDPALREGVSGQLLAQAAAELQVAAELLNFAVEQAPDAKGPAPRAAGGASLRDAIDGLEQAMAQPVSSGLMPAFRPRGETAPAATPEESKKALRQAAAFTTGAISQKVIEVGGGLAFNLVFKTQWTAVIQGAGLMNKDVAKLLDCLKEGAGKAVQSAVTAAARTIANVYDKILALMGKDAEDQARKQIQKWLNDIKNEGKIALFEQLVGKLYRVDTIEKDLTVLLEKTSVETGKISATASEVAALSAKFNVLVDRLQKIDNIVGLARFIQAGFPEVLVVTTGIQVMLLTVLVYEGYDYIGFKQGKFLNLTRGVAEIIQENLAAPAAPPANAAASPAAD